jgi:hypothetical protein
MSRRHVRPAAVLAATGVLPLVVSGASVPGGVRDSASVQTKQIAPMILSLLGLDPRSLQAVREEHTTALPVR